MACLRDRSTSSKQDVRWRTFERQEKNLFNIFAAVVVPVVVVDDAHLLWRSRPFVLVFKPTGLSVDM